MMQPRWVWPLLLLPWAAFAADKTPALVAGKYVLAATFPDGADYVCFRPASGEQSCLSVRTPASGGAFTFGGAAYTGAPAAATSLAVLAADLTAPVRVTAVAGNAAGEALSVDAFVLAPPAKPKPAAPAIFVPVLAVTPPPPPPPPVPPQPTAGLIFQDGLDSGDQRNWDGKGGTPSVVSSGCHDGPNCVQMALHAGSWNESAYLWKDLGKTSIDFRGDYHAGVWMRFPPGFTWEESSDPRGGDEHKVIIADLENCPNGQMCPGRMLLTLRGAVPVNPTLAIYFESLEAYGYGNGNGVSQRSGVSWPNDGAWHHLEWEVAARQTPHARVRVWLDDVVAIDATGRVCADTCAMIEAFKIGAFVNQGSKVNQSFFWDTFTLYSGPRPVPANLASKKN